MIPYKISASITIILCLSTVYGLFSIKDNVMTLRAELQEVQKQIRNEEDTIRILKAELTYLGSPERIQKLAYKYLHLEKPKVTQMIKDPLLGDSLEQPKIMARAKFVKKGTKWHYKEGPSKYVTMAKGQK